MKHRAILPTFVAALVLLAASMVPAGAGSGNRVAPGSFGGAKLQMYDVLVDAATAQEIVAGGYDVVTIKQAPGEQVRLTLVLYPWERKALDKLGATLNVWRNDAGKTATALALAQAASGFKVWRDYDDSTTGFEDYMHDIEAANPGLLKLYDIGPDTHQGRDILALRLTDESVGGDKPAVLYTSLQHAREWISAEVNRRLLEWYIKKYTEGVPQIVNLLESTELWFVLIANPDGYQYTFDPLGDRLWRKNLRDNDGDTFITPNDGVDPNRNFPEHFNFDEEGSASVFSDQTYRGPSAGSEPETQAMMDVYALADPVFHVNYHSFGELLLYTFGFQVQTPSADDPIFVALSGTDKKPAIQDFNPGVGADLYVTNGETTDWAHASEGTLAWTPELSEGSNGSGFVFPDSNGQVENEFKKNLPFALDVALSAADPDDPVSHQGFSTDPFYLDVSQLDPQKAYNPLSDFSFAYSYGDPQPVEILAKRNLDGVGGQDAVTVHWSVNGEAAQDDSTSEWSGGERFGISGDEYYRIVRGMVSGFDDGDSVEVWFTGGGETSDSFTFEAISDTGDPVLVLAAEDYSGPSTVPTYPFPGALSYESYYTDALTSAGYSSDVYDVDAMGRTAPDHLGVLSHYDAVVWYTGNDFLTREPGQVPGTGASTLANTEVLEVRSYLNEGGRLLYTGVNAGWQYYNAFPYNPVSTPPYCDGTIPNSTNIECLLLSDDFGQYWLGGYLFIEDGGTDPGTGLPSGISGVSGGPFTASAWTLNDGDSADNHNPKPVGTRGTTQSLLTTSSLLPIGTYPQFTSSGAAVWDSAAGAFSPNTGSYYAYSQRADITYKRLMATFPAADVTGSGPDSTLSFAISADTEPAWDFVFVEAQVPGSEDWTTLPEVGGATTNSTGDSCPEGWHDLHPWLEQYQGADCSGVGWNAFSGRTDSWEAWEFDLSGFDTTGVEISISYVSDWSFQGLGVFLDDIDGPGLINDTGFEGGTLAPWVLGVPTEIGSAANANDWIARTDVGFVEGAAVTMDPGGDGVGFRTVYLGFGFEGITDGTMRDDLMAEAMAYLLVP